jgi:hypothetical protein
VGGRLKACHARSRSPVEPQHDRQVCYEHHAARVKEAFPDRHLHGGGGGHHSGVEWTAPACTALVHGCSTGQCGVCELRVLQSILRRSAACRRAVAPAVVCSSICQPHARQRPHQDDDDEAKRIADEASTPADRRLPDAWAASAVACGPARHPSRCAG